VGNTKAARERSVKGEGGIVNKHPYLGKKFTWRGGRSTSGTTKGGISGIVAFRAVGEKKKNKLEQNTTEREREGGTPTGARRRAISEGRVMEEKEQVKCSGVKPHWRTEKKKGDEQRARGVRDYSRNEPEDDYWVSPWADWGECYT